MSRADIEHLEDRVTGFLLDMGLLPEAWADNTYGFRYGNVVVLVGVFEAVDASWVRIAAPLLEDFRPNLELVTRILRLNTEVLLGSFLIFEDDTLSFSFTLPGEGLERGPFEIALGHVARISNAYGEDLASIAGGRSISDILQS